MWILTLISTVDRNESSLGRIPYLRFMNWQAERAMKRFFETGKPTVIIHDNASIHRSKLVKKQHQISKLVNSLKSVSSRRLRQEFLPELERVYFPKKVLWNSSYFLASCGGVTIATLRKYIENQNSPISSLILAIHPTLIAIAIQTWGFSRLI